MISPFACCQPRRKHGLLALLWVAASLFPQVLPAHAQTTTSTIPFIYDFASSNQAAIFLAPDAKKGMFHVSDPIGIQTTNGNPFRVLNTFGTVVCSATSTNIQLPCGHYFVETDGDRMQFDVLPDDYAQCLLVGTASTGAWNVTDQLNALQGPTWERSLLGMWTTVQPARGVWDWTGMDRVVAALQGTNRKLIYMAADTVPYWVGTNELIDAYAQFTAAALQRYGSQIYGWEIWNEPAYDKFGGTSPADAARVFMGLATAAQSARKHVHSHVKLVGPSWSGPGIGIPESRIMVDNGILRILDYWSFHDYTAGDYAPDQSYLNVYPISTRTKTNFGARVAKKPILITEGAFYGGSSLGIDVTSPWDSSLTKSSLTWYRGYCRTIKATIMYRAAGVTGIIPNLSGLFDTYPSSNWEIYTWDMSPWSPTSPPHPRGPHPKTTAFLMTSYWLNHAKGGRAMSINDQVYLYAWKRPKTGTVLFAWCVEGQTRTIGALPGYRITDIYGHNINPGTLGEEPVMFRPIKGRSPQRAIKDVTAVLTN